MLQSNSSAKKLGNDSKSASDLICFYLGRRYSSADSDMTVRNLLNKSTDKFLGNERE